MAEIWMPGVRRYPGGKSTDLTGGPALFTHHTFECGYDVTTETAARVLIGNGSEAHFVFNPITGAIGQLLPANVGARTLRGGQYLTNRYGRVHMQMEVIGRAANPWTSDLTPAGRDTLARLLDFLESWGIPSRWCDGIRPPAYPSGSVRRGTPTESGHWFHAGWVGNDHGDPGAIADPWTVIGDPSVMAAQRLYNAALADRPEFQPLDVDGIEGPLTIAAKETYMTTLDQLADLIKDQDKTIAALGKKIDGAPAATAKAVWQYNLKGQDASYWARLAAGGIRTDADGNPVAVTPVIPPIDGPVA